VTRKNTTCHSSLVTEEPTKIGERIIVNVGKEFQMKKVDYMAVAEKVMAQIKEGAFLTVKADKGTNTMTIGWGLIGYAWRKPVLMVLVRTSRHTYGFIEKASDFTVTVPTSDMRDALMFCGTKSGRDVDKYKVSSPISKTPAIQFECRIVLKTPMDPKCLDKECQGLYPAKDYHTLYFGEIVECYEME
jgi:flavin reductase (DIM6/NTAB) family NADH-FMN oxidoreductase RutF